jgi:hypothetical protein
MEAMMNLRPAGNPVRQVSLAGGGVEILYSASTTVDVSSLAARFGRKDGVPGAPDWGGLEPFARRPDIDTTEIAESLRQMFEDEGDLCFVTSLTPGAVAVYED